MKELQQILAVLKSVSANDAILATLVHVEGSSYRRPGARLLLTADGRRVGSISGGCLEDDVIAQAQAVRASGTAKTITYDTTTENDLVWGVGLGCHGVVQVLLEKLPPQPLWADALRENFRLGRPTELAVVWGGPPGTRLGTYLVGELPAAHGPESALIHSHPGSARVPRADAGVSPAHPPENSRRDAESSPRDACAPWKGSEKEPAPSFATVFRQTIPAPTHHVIFCAGDDVRPLVRFARELGWHITVADPRPALATPERFPEADAVVVARPDEAPARFAPGTDALAVIMTHHYRHDLPLLHALLPRPLAYLGLLGPKKRAERILSDLAAEGFVATPEMRSRLHAPVGLDLGADHPEEVALAILAEMTAVLAGRDARPLRDRTQPIHS
jgi:xanthine dehydrogenase accessory factor